MTLTAIEPDVYPWFNYRGDTFCLGLVDGNSAWTSGQSASVSDPATGRRVIEGDLAAQAELAYTKLLAVLADAGLHAPDVVHITENVTIAGISDYADAATVRRRLFGDAPTVTTVVVDRLVRSKALIEIELHAVPGGGTQLGAPTLTGTHTKSPTREGHDGTIHLPTMLPLDPFGAVVSPGDPIAQFNACLDAANTALSKAGVRPDQVVACHLYGTPAVVGLFEEFDAARREAFGDRTVGGGVITQRLHRDGVTIAIDVTASRHAKTIVDPGWGATGQGYPAIRVGDTLYCSALASEEGTLEAQATQVYDRLITLLKHAGLAAESLRSTIEFCAADLISDYKVVAPIRAARLSPPWPASTGDLCTRFRWDGTLLQTVAIAHYNAGAVRPAAG